MRTLDINNKCDMEGCINDWSVFLTFSKFYIKLCNTHYYNLTKTKKIILKDNTIDLKHILTKTPKFEDTELVIKNVLKNSNNIWSVIKNKRIKPWGEYENKK